jgi:hypothetical protein
MEDRSPSRFRSLWLPSHATVIAYLALFVSLGGGAYAFTSTSSSNTIDGCYSKHTGSLRIASHGVCKHGEIALQWNQQGAAGTQGVEGKPGAEGKQGPEGKAGAEGKVDTSDFYTKEQADDRYLPLGGTAANASELEGHEASAFADSSLFGSALGGFNGDSEEKECQVGQILLTAAIQTPRNTFRAEGQTLPITGHEALFALLGTNYGGNGTTNFVLPNLEASVPRSSNGEGTDYVICFTGTFP